MPFGFIGDAFKVVKGVVEIGGKAVSGDITGAASDLIRTVGGGENGGGTRGFVSRPPARRAVTRDSGSRAPATSTQPAARRSPPASGVVATNVANSDVRQIVDDLADTFLGPRRAPERVAVEPQPAVKLGGFSLSPSALLGTAAVGVAAFLLARS